MKPVKTSLIIVELMFLAIYGNSAWATNTTSLATSQDIVPTKTEAVIAHSTESKKGQVVESGPYHLEFAYKPENAGTRLDFYLQKGENHLAVPNAKVIAQIQMPDGKQKTLNFTYNAKGKHYTALLSGKIAGQHQVKIISDISGEKVDGRFAFSR